MGSCIASSNSQERNISNQGRMAVKPNQDHITSEILDMALANSNPMNSLKSKVCLTFQAQNLPNLDKGSKSDPMLVLWQIDGR